MDRLKHVRILARGIFCRAATGRLLALLLITQVLGLVSAAAQDISPGALAEIQALEQEKAARTPAQQKVDSNLLYGHREKRDGRASPAAPHLRADVKFQADGRVLVDITATVSEELLAFIGQNGGLVASSFPQYNAIRAVVPIEFVETLAGRPDVRFVSRAHEFHTNASSTDPEGDFTHAANTARTTFGADGTGVKVGIMSGDDGSNSLAITLGDLPTNVVTLSGQSGVPGEGEGTAMMEVVYRLAPGAQLYFATGLPPTSPSFPASEAQMASNILALAAAGCNIIADDISFPDESPFQESQPVSAAVQTVSDEGVLYFSCARNSGNLDSGQSATWEGDFSDGGAVGSPITGESGGRLHSFAGTTYDTVTAVNGPEASLFWADPLGASTNDYDLFILNSGGTAVVESSTSVQNGTQDPYEYVSTLAVNDRVVIVKHSGAGRFLHLDVGRCQIAIATAGCIRGHNCSSAANAFCVAATPANTAFQGPGNNPTGPYPNPFTGAPANVVELFSSDGPRRLFFNTNGTPITPGNFSSTGGSVLNKPDFTAADGVSTTVFSPYFFGTSCATPHAAAIAAMLLSYKPSLTPAQVRSILSTNALDIMAAGYDRDSGYGILMPGAAMTATPVPPPVITAVSPPSAIAGTQILLYGTNFATLTNVQFNGVSATFTDASNIVLLTTVPAGATTGPLRLTTRWGTSSVPFTVLPTPPPANDNFANAQVLSGTLAMVPGTTAGASKEAGEPNHAGNAGGKSIWYTWTAPGSGTFSLDTVGSSFNTLLAVYTGSAVNALTAVASNAGGGANGTSALTFNAVSGTVYRIAVDGVGGASGSVVLRLEPAPTTIYSTGFEPADGFSTALPLNGQSGWTNGGVGTGGNGIVTNYFTGDGQQAYVGFSSPTPATNTFLYHPLNFTLDTNTRPIVTFSMLMDVNQSNNGFYDNFWWIIQNTGGHSLFGLEFANSQFFPDVYYALDNGAGPVFSTSFTVNAIHNLVVNMNFGANTWSANLDAIPLVFQAQQLTTTGAPLTLGNINVGWVFNNTTNPGNNYLLFDNFQVTASPSLSAKILSGPQGGTMPAGSSVFLRAVAVGNAPITYQWYQNGNPISGATNAFLSFDNAVAHASGTYLVTAANSLGNDSASAVLTITNPVPHAVLGQAAWSGTNGLFLNLNLAVGDYYSLLASTNLTNWSTLTTFYAGATNTVCIDPGATNLPRRFYRLVSP